MKRWLMFLLICALSASAPANPWNGQVVLQGFWWDYWNNNYPNNWSTYLADLAPRLSDMGIDAIWIPPTIKNKNATGSVGYAPFDHYDLGDKYQCGSTATRFGTKDQYLRAVAILHANGIDVIQDVVWNHMDGAGSETGAGGQDPTAPSNQYKNFRYVCFATPETGTDAASYGARRGRFPKNWENFHPNPDHNTEADDITAGFFGPDICYYSNARGLSSNCSFNPAQGSDYMRNGIRNWSIWMKKQTGVDGFRLDAAKHFETWATQDFLWNLAFNAGFTSGGNHMYAVGEFIGSSVQMDGWVDAANAANGGTVDLVGTFDFNLRGALKAVVDGNGGYDLGSLPGAQQNRRSRTAPFVNNHDTFRPILDANGRYSGWDSSQEIGGHIDPNDVRAPVAYAAAFAVDGSPQVYFEDLFDLHSTGKRWTHSPTNLVDLPVRGWLTNQIWCHQKLNFKDGAYKVRWQAADLLVIERSAHAIIGVNDQFGASQSATVQTDFGANVLLHDYSGANAADVQTDGAGRVTITVPPCTGADAQRGYAIWGPTGVSGGIARTIRPVTQEWEMSDDLGDSHSSSLLQGGALPANSTATRTVGKVYAAANKPVLVEGFASNAAGNWKMSIITGAAQPPQASGAGNLTLAFTPTQAAFYTIQIRNATTSEPSQTVWVKATYTSTKNRFSTGPVFKTPLTNIYSVAGQHPILQADMTANPAASFQWSRNGTQVGGDSATLADVVAGDYVLRVWNEAALVQSAPVTVTVYDDASAQLANLLYSNSEGFSFQVAGKVGLHYSIESSGDLIDWMSAGTGVAPFSFHDGASDTLRFFRLTYLH